MRRLVGNRKLEYIKPISTDGDKEKTIELIVQMYNQHYSQIDKFELTTVTQKNSFERYNNFSFSERRCRFVGTLPGRHPVS